MVGGHFWSRQYLHPEANDVIANLDRHVPVDVSGKPMVHVESDDELEEIPVPPVCVIIDLFSVAGSRFVARSADRQIIATTRMGGHSMYFFVCMTFIDVFVCRLVIELVFPYT